VRFDSSGPHLISWGVYAPYQTNAHASVSVAVVDPPAVAVAIVTPLADGSEMIGSTIFLEANALGATPFAHQWIWRTTGCGDFVIPTQRPGEYPIPAPTFYELWDTSTTPNICLSNVGSIVLDVTDANAVNASASIPFSIYGQPN